MKQTEVEERDLAVGPTQEVAGVGVARELALAEHRPVEEAEDDLADAIALGVVLGLELRKAVAVHELGDDQPLPRQAGQDVRNHDEGVAAVDAREHALVAGLQFVVELLDDPLAHLVGKRLHVKLWGDLADEPEDQPEVLQVGLDRAVDPRVLDLDRDLPTIDRRPVHLPDRRSRDRLLVEIVEHCSQRRTEVLLDHLAHVLERNRRRGVAQLRELALELLAILLRDEADIHERQHLADLHRGALHRPEHGHDLPGGLDVALLERGRRFLVGAHDVRCMRARPPCGLTGRSRADLRQAPIPAGGHALIGHRWDSLTIVPKRPAQLRSPSEPLSRSTGP